MRIAVNTRLLIDDIHGGIEWFTYESIRRIVSDHPEHEFIFYFDRPYNKRYIFTDNIEPVVLRPAAVHPFLWYYWFEILLPSSLKKVNADIFVSPDGMMPSAANIPCIPVIHDINFFHRKSDLPYLKSLYYRKYFRKFAYRATRIVTVSEYSKQDMITTWQIPADRIDVAYNGVSDVFSPSGQEQQKLTRAKYSSGKNYFLFVGNLSPRKNVPNLIRAYEKYRDTYDDDSMLMVAGDRFFLNSELDKVYHSSPRRDEIRFTGKCSREELQELYSAAIALVFIPWFEGFGIPLVEAMRCGTPVIASNTTSIPEIASGAALLVNPGDIEEVAGAMRRIRHNENLRQQMTQSGMEVSKRYSWDKTALSLWQSIELTINKQ